MATSPEGESHFLGLFEKIAQGNHGNQVPTYGKTYAMGAAIATRHPSRGTEIIELMQRLQDHPTAVEMADLMIRLRDETDVNAKDGNDVGRHLQQLNPNNKGAAYGTAFMIGLQAALADKTWSKQVMKIWETAGERELSHQLEEQTYEIAKQDRRSAGLH